MKRLVLIALFAAVVAQAGTAIPDDVRCSVCGKIIPDQTKYYLVGGSREVICESCFLQAPRCSVCRKPTAAADLDKDTGACLRCLAGLSRCKTCGKAIIGTAYTSSYAKGVYCAECKNTRPACYICGVPVGRDYWRFPDGRIICGECCERAVIDIDRIKEIMEDARETVERSLGLFLEQPYVVTVEKLASVTSAARSDRYTQLGGDSPLYGHELGMYRQSGTRSEIFLLFGLPPDLLYEAAAHEYAHAWQAENCPPDLSPELREGFAQYAAAEVLRIKGFRSALENLEARRDFPYGTGYQRLKRLHQSLVLDLLLRGR
jgi:hypothetical protein